MQMKNNFIQLSEIAEKQIMPGLIGRFVHSGNMTLAYWRFDPDVTVPEHAHEHEQIVNVIEGTIDLTVEGETHRLEPGSVVIIPPNASHSGRSVTSCRVIDAFHPVRQDLL
jgi:quercetin dioxygenase-like cupin family protein